MNRDRDGMDSTDALLSRFARSVAVIIGIGDYGGGIPTLTTPKNDARHLAQLLKRDHGYEIVLLVEEVTKARLERLFSQALPGAIGADDRLLLYFAGHGIACDGDDGPQGYLVPQDAQPNDPSSLLAMTELHRWLSALPCRHMLAVFDCCFAGAFRWVSTRHIGVLPEVIHKERFDRFLQSPAWQVITSASYDQRALDLLTGTVVDCLGTRNEEDDQHSPFARAFFDGISKQGDLSPKEQGDGVITASELALYLRDTVEVEVAQQATLEQTPQIWPLNKHRKGEYIFLVPGCTLDLPPAESLTKENNPYRGLKPYERKHRDLFFGRKEEAKELSARIESQPFVAVLGASGTGKSSLVKAGLLPRLADAGPRWFVLPPMRPTDHPVQALSSLLRQHLPDTPFTLDSKHGLAHAVADFQSSNPSTRLVLTVDQCEELVTLCHDEKESEQFLTLLAEAVRAQPDAFRLIITLRSDFEQQLAHSTPLESGWKEARYCVPPMDQSDLRDVIEGPASVRVLYFEPPELVDELINEVIQMPGALPLLSFTLSEMYLRYLRSGRDDRSLRQEDYEALGGVIGSLRQRANEEYDTLPDNAHRATMQRVMLRMISAQGSELARRRVMLDELDYPTAEENRRVKVVLDRLVDARLLVRGSTDFDQDGVPDPYVEPAHDALMAAWDRLLQWKREAEEYLPLQRQAAQAALEWTRAPESEKTGLLWNDRPRLPQLEEHLAPKGSRSPLDRVRRALWPAAAAPKDTAWLNRHELAFTQASVQREAATLRRIVGITVAVIIVLAGLAVVAWTQAALARESEATAVAEGDRRATEVVVRTTAQAGEAEARQVAQTRESDAQAAATAEAEAHALADQRRLEAEAEALAWEAINVVETNPELALLLARQAVETTYQVDGEVMPRADAALQLALASPFRHVFQSTGTRSFGYEPIVAPDGSSFLGYGTDGWTLYASNYQAMETLKGNWPYFSPDSQSIATIDDRPDGQPGRLIRLYGTDGALRTEFVVALSDLGSPAFSPDGQTLLAAGCTGSGAGCEAGQVQVLSTDGQLLNAISSSSRTTPGATFNPADSRQALVTMDDGAVLWDLETGETRRLAADAAPVASAAFSGDGERVATLSKEGLIHLWDKGGNHLTTLSARDQSPEAMVLNHDGTRILSSSSDPYRVTLLDTTGAVLATIEEDLWAVDPHSSRFATAGLFGTGQVSVWDDAGNSVARFQAHRSEISSLHYTPDGRYLVTSGCDSALTMGMTCEALNTRLWSFDDRLVADVASDGEAILALQAAPDGEHLLAIECDRRPEALNAPEVCQGSESRQRLGAIWNLATRQAAPLGMPGDYAAAATIAPGGDRVLLLQCEPGTGTGDCGHPQLIAYNLDGQRTGEIADPRLATVEAGTIDPDGTQILFLNASPGPGSTLLNDGLPAPLYLWEIDADRWTSIGGPEDRFDWAALSPDGQHLATVIDYPAELSLWDLEGSLLATATLGTADDYTEDSWGRFSPDGQWIALSSCTMGHMGQCDDSTVYLWSLVSNQVRSLSTGTGVISSMEFSADGHLLVVVNGDEKLVRLWHTSEDGVPQMRATLTGFTSPPLSAAIRPQGDKLLTAHDDGTVWLWDLDGNSLGTIKAFGRSLNMAVFSGDGAQVVAVGCDAFPSNRYQCEPEIIRSWSLWQDTQEMLDEADLRLGARAFTPEECQSYLGSEECP